MSIKDIMPNAVLRSKAGYPPSSTHPRYSSASGPQGAFPRTLCVPLWLWGLATAPHGQLFAALHGAAACCFPPPPSARGCCVLSVAIWLYLPDSVASWVVCRLPRMVQSHRQILGQALCCSTYILSNGSTGFSPYN